VRSAHVGARRYAPFGAARGRALRPLRGPAPGVPASRSLLGARSALSGRVAGGRGI